ncbi:MAG: TIGR00725 family protein [Thermodesulfovibrionales bacterium]
MSEVQILSPRPLIFLNSVQRMVMGKKIIAIIGAGRAEGDLLKIAEKVGRLVAERNAILVCGGLGGVMEAAAKGAKEAGGTTIGILPSDRKDQANPYIDIPIPTGFGDGRNVIIIRTADAVIAVGGEYGTLSEIAFALKAGKPVAGIKSWDINGIIKADNDEDAINKIFDLLKS